MARQLPQILDVPCAELAVGQWQPNLTWTSADLAEVMCRFRGENTRDT